MERRRIDAKLVASMYSGGMNQTQVAKALGTYPGSVSHVMKMNGIPVRPSKGSASPFWKGDAVGYEQAHRRVRKERGAPKRCEECGTTDASKSYDWANISGKFHDPSDYRRLCRSCHAKLDRLAHRNGTHPGTPAARDRRKKLWN